MRELVGQHSCAPGQTALLRVVLGPALVTYRGRERERVRFQGLQKQMSPAS